MSTTIDERVVEMRFDNSQFEAGVKTSLSTLDKLKEGLDLDGAAKGLEGLGDAAKKCDLSTLSNSVETVRMKFSALEVMAVTALSKITSSAIDTGERLVKSLTVDQVTAGWDKYADKTSAVQTIMAATAKDFTDTGEQMEYVNSQLTKLNWFTDETSYSFLDMVNNIGKFTSNNIALDKSVTAMQGISTWAAISGANTQEAGRAMYNLSQAIAVGSVKLMDWKSIENANMATAEFKQTAIDTAVAMGTLTKNADGTFKTLKGNTVTVSNFNEALSDAWFTSDVLLETLDKYGGFTDKLYKAAEKTDLSASELLDYITKYKDGTADLGAISKETGMSVEDLTAMFDELGDETFALGQRSFRAAQEAKTFKDAIDSVKDAVSTGWMNTFEIIFGNYEEAKVLWTNLANAMYDAFASGAEARNELLSEWKELGGRDALIESFWNTWDGIASVLNSIRDAFRDIFPATTAEQLLHMTETLRDFTAKLALSDTASENLKNTFKGLFAILDICKQAIGAILGPVGSLLGKVTGLGGGVLGVTGSIGEWLVKLDEAIKKNDTFGKGIEKISDFVSGAVAAIKNFAESVREYLGLPTLDEAKESLKELFGTAKEKIQVPGLELLHTILEKLKERAGQVKDALIGMKDGVLDAFSKLGSGVDGSKFVALIQALWTAAKKIGGGLFDALGEGLNKIVTALSNADFSGIIDLLNGISIGGIAVAITKFTKSLTTPFDEVGGLLDNVKGILDGVRGCFEAYQTQLKAGTLLKIAGAIAILAASIVAISLIDSEKLSASLGAITVLFADLVASMAIFTKISGNSKGMGKSSAMMLAMSTSVLIIASALKKIADLDGGQLAKGVAGVTALMAAMVGAVKLLGMGGGSSMKGATQMILFAASIKILASACTDLATLEWNELAKGLTGVGVLLAEVSLFMNTAKFSGKSLTTAAGIVVLASAIKILASACKDLGSLDFGQLVKGLGSIGILLAEITAFTKLTGDAKGLVSTGLAMIEIGAAMKIFASAMGDFGNLEWNQIAKGLVAMGGALAEVAIAMKVMPKNTVSVGVGLIAVGAALEIVANALGKMGGMTWEEIAKGLVTMGGALAELAIGLNVMNGTLAGSAAMLVAAGALAVLTPVLLTLGSMSWESIAKGLVTIAGAFTVIGVAGALLTPLTPTILALAGAFALIGVGTAAIGAGLLAAGAGLSAISVGITALATSLGAGVTVIVAGLSTIITGIAALIPAVAEKLGEAIVAFCGVIAQGAPAIGEAVKAVILTLVDVLVECVPAIADGALALLSGVLASLANYTPEIVDSIMLFLINLLNGIAERLPELIQAAVNVIAAFFSGIIDALAGLDTSVLVKTIAGIGLLSGIMVALGAVSALIPSAMAGVLGMGVLIAELAVVLAAVGALAQIPGLSWLIGEGGKLLEQIGTAIGGFVGGIVGGFMSGISSQFPQIGSDLASFMTNVQPFIDGASSISPAMFDGVQALTDAILLLTKAELVQGIASWFTGSSSLSDFADQLVPFGESMAEFSNAISGMDADLVSKAATAGKALAEMATTLPNSGGVVGFFAGENDMDKFGEQLVPFGKAMKDYSLAVKGMDANAISNSTSAGKALVELADTIPNCGGLVSFFTGDNSIADFGDQLVLFGDGLAAYSTSIEGINMSKLSSAIAQVEKLVALADTVKNMDQYAFVNFTNALVLLANTSIQNFTDAFYNSGATVSTAIIYMLNSAGMTIRQNQTIVNVAMAELMLAMAATVKAHTTSMNTAVVQMMVGFSTTIRSNGTSVRTAMQSVMMVVVAEVNNYKSQFNEAGKNVSQGFINGIRSKLSGASQAGRDLGLAALNAAKKALDSHSPSREFIELGKNIGEGMTIGINNAIVPVSSAAAKMSDEAIKVAQTGIDAFKDWAEERKYYSELSLKEELAGWETLQKKYREGSEERKQIDREVYRVQNELVTATYQYSMDWIEEQKSYGKLTLAEELAAYKRVQSRYAKGTELRKKLDLQVYQLEKEISDAQKQYISDVQAVQSEANQKRLDLEEEYADKVKSINAQLASYIQAENDKYENALKSREDSLYKSYGLFDAVKERDEVSGDTLMKNLEGQVKEFGEWQDILESLAGRGLDSDLLEELQDMGPDAIAQIKALNEMSDSELEKYADLWKVKHAMAREQAVSELEGLREETQQNIAKLREEADQELTEYRALWQQKMNQVTEDANAQLEQLRRNFEEKVGLIKNNTEDELQEMSETAQKILTEAGWDETGKQIVQGLTDGVKSEKSSFVDEITQMALAAVQAAKSTLDINSPSRVFREIGNYTGLGFVKGLQDYVDRSYAAGSEMAESAEGGLSGVLQTIADIVSGGFDMEPVIRPVLDLSAVSAGADALNNLFYSQRAVGLVNQAAVAFEAQRGGDSQTTISVDNDDVVAELRTLRGEMASMLERMEKLRVVLNTGTLVGELVEPMDVALGQRSTQKGRGI